MSFSTLPSTYKALHFEDSSKPLVLKDTPLPSVIPGTVLVKILTKILEPALDRVLSGGVPGLNLPPSSIPGGRAVARVVLTSVDTTSLKEGQLVVIEPFLRGRDNPDTRILWGLGVFGEDRAALKLSHGIWRNGLMGEYGLAPLENVYALDEARLCGEPEAGGLGYSFGELAVMTRHMVAYGGLRSIGLQAGERIVIAPATGAFSGAAVEVATAMGANVIAVGRRQEKLERLAALNPRVTPFKLQGDVQDDLAALKKLGTIDAYLDLSPHTAGDATYARSCIMAVKPYGRVSLMGYTMKDVPVPYAIAVLNCLTIRGQYMYEREDVRGTINLVESGLIRLGKAGGYELLGEFGLQEYDKGTQVAKDANDPQKLVVLRL